MYLPTEDSASLPVPISPKQPIGITIFSIWQGTFHSDLKAMAKRLHRNWL